MAGRFGRTILAAIISILLVWTCTSEAQEVPKISPIFGVALPERYRQWQLIAPAREAAPFGELRAILGNDVAVEAYRNGQLPFPDGAILVKIAWKEVQSPEFESATIPGAASTVQVMVKDSKRYATTGGWGSGVSSTASRPPAINTRRVLPAMKLMSAVATAYSRARCDEQFRKEFI